MDYIDNAGICSLIRNEQINFVGTAVTPWHAHGIDCAIKYLQDRGVNIKGVIIISLAIKQGKVTHLLTENNFINTCCIYYKQKASFDTSLRYIINNLRENWHSVKAYNRQKGTNSTVYIVSAWHPNMNLFIYLRKNLNTDYNFKLMVVEEGLSTYFPEVKSTKHIWNLTKLSKNGVSLLVSFAYQLLTTTLRNRFENKAQLINLNLLVENNERLQPNIVACKYYRKVLAEYSNKYLQHVLIPDLNDCILIGTMAYLHSEIQGNSDVITLQKIVDELVDAGYRVYIKPHPRDVGYRERYATLRCEFIDVPCSIETLMVKYPNLKAIISFSSTSLVTAQLLFNIKSISILNIIEKDKYGKYIQDEMDSFEKCFSTVVDIPHDISEMIQLLK